MIGGCLLFAVSSQTEVGNILRWANLTKGGDRPSKLDRLTEDDEIRTGSIVFMPSQGDECQQNLFDNDTGRIWVIGAVPCDVALALKRPRYASTPQRLQAISNTFRISK